MPATDPTLTVEIAFGSAPFDTPVWTDVTAYVKSVSTRRGKQTALDDPQAGTATVVLDNSDGRFDPNNSSSPYYPNVVPLRKLRVSATWDAVTYGVFSGFVESWPQPYGGIATAEAPISAVDGFKILNLQKVTGSFPEQLSSERVAEVLDVVGWPAADRDIDTGQTTVQGDDAVAWQLADQKTASYSGTVIDLQQPANVEAGDLLVAVITSNVSNTSAAVWPTAPDGWTTVAESYDVAVSGPAVAVYTKRAGTTEPDYFRWSGGASGEHRGLIGRVLGAGSDISAVVARDGSPVSSLQLAATTADRDALIVAAWAWSSSGTTTLPGTMTSAHTNTSAPGSAWGYESVSAGAVGTRTATSTASSKVAAAEVVILAAKTLDEANPLQHLLTVARTENGLFFVGRDGEARFVSRHGLIGGLTDAANYTFGDGAGEKEYDDIVVAYDDADIWNDIRVSSEGLEEVQSTDATSQTEYLTRTLTRSGLLLTSTTEQQAYADFLLYSYKDPALRVDAVSFQVVDFWDQLLDRELGSKVLVTRDPPGSGSTIAQWSYVEGVAWDIAPGPNGNWRVGWNLAALTRRAQFWVLGDPVQGVLGSTTRLAY